MEHKIANFFKKFYDDIVDIMAFDASKEEALLNSQMFINGKPVQINIDSRFYGEHTDSQYLTIEIFEGHQTVKDFITSLRHFVFDDKFYDSDVQIYINGELDAYPDQKIYKFEFDKDWVIQRNKILLSEVKTTQDYLII